MAFASILKGPVHIVQYIDGVLPVLLAHMKDPHSLVRDSAAWAIGRVALFHHKYIGKYLPQVLLVLTESLELNSGTIKVATKICWTIHCIAEVCFIE